MIHFQEGAQININGTGIANSHPDISIRRRETLWERLPAKRLVTALARLKVALNETIADLEVMPNSASARPGRTERSMPIIPPRKRITVSSKAQNGASYLPG